MSIRSLRRRSAGFTLVELLGVIIIIAILAAVIFPAIQAAIRKSQSSSSAQNLRQWGLAQLQFIADHGHYAGCNAKFRHLTDGTKSHRARWINVLSPYLNASAEASTNKQGVSEFESDGVTETEAAGGEGVGDEDQSVFSATFKDPLVSHWKVGRNNSYGYNYQYLGNDRARSGYDGSATTPALDEDGDGATHDEKVGFVNYPVTQGQITRPDLTIMFAESDGTGTGPYVDQFSSSKHMNRIGNHGYLLDPALLPIRDCDQDGLVDDRPGPCDSAGPATIKDIVDRNYFDYTTAAVGTASATSTTSWSDHLTTTGAPWDNNGARGIISNRHNGGANICFADGHVEWKLREECYWDETGRKSNRLWNGFGRDNKDEGVWKDRTTLAASDADYADGLASLEADEVIDPNEEIFVSAAGDVLNYGVYDVPRLVAGAVVTAPVAGAAVEGTRPKVPPLHGSYYKEGVGAGGS